MPDPPTRYQVTFRLVSPVQIGAGTHGMVERTLLYAPGRLLWAALAKAMAEELAHHRQLIRNRLEVRLERAPQVIEEYHQRLRSRIAELTARAELPVAEQDLIREVAIFADRADIREEVTRLRAHLDHFEKIVASDDQEPAGRSLDFLSQELLREANTIASKSNDAEINRAIVEVKGAIDRIKEQVQNVE